MHKGSYIFRQLCSVLPKDHFDYLLDKYEVSKDARSFSYWNHLLVMLWAQLSRRESLRDIVDSLKGHRSKFYNLGFGNGISRSTLSDANSQRNVHVFEEYAKRMVGIASERRVDVNRLFVEEHGGRLLALDASVLSFPHDKFPWSAACGPYEGLKLHSLFDILSSIPVCNLLTDVSVGDQSVMHQMPYERGNYYVFDRAYVKREVLQYINDIGAWYVVRRKRRMSYRILETNVAETENGIRKDHIVLLDGQWARRRYRTRLRYILFYDEEKDREMEFFSNILHEDACFVTSLYRQRWQIELFFKWIKQHLRIRRFYGTSENAVKIQIYCCIIAYCMVAVAEREYALDMSIFDVLRILSTTLFEKRDIRQLFEQIRTQEKGSVEENNLHFVTLQTMLNFPTGH